MNSFRNIKVLLKGTTNKAHCLPDSAPSCTVLESTTVNNITGIKWQTAAKESMQSVLRVDSSTLIMGEIYDN